MLAQLGELDRNPFVRFKWVEYVNVHKLYLRNIVLFSMVRPFCYCQPSAK